MAAYRFAVDDWTHVVRDEGGRFVLYADYQREVFHLQSEIKKLQEDLVGYKHIAQRDQYYEAFLEWWEGRKD